MSRNMFCRVWTSCIRLWSDTYPIFDHISYALACALADKSIKDNKAIEEIAIKCGVSIEGLEIMPLPDGFEKGHRYSYASLTVIYDDSNRNEATDYGLEWLFNTVIEKFCVDEDLDMFIQGL